VPQRSEETPVVVVGASAAGLAVSACLKRAGVPHVLLEQAPAVAGAWRSHYARLHLHTPRGASALPGLDFPADVPRYPSRLQVVAYLERYVEVLGLSPRLGERVRAVRPGGSGWVTETDRGTLASRHVVLATGLTRTPWMPSWPGQAAFQGPVVHSAAYGDGERFRGQRVLVVGFGNSAGEIALDLDEHGARPTLAVRGPVNVIPRDLLGLPILAVAALFRPLPPRLADLLSAPLVRAAVGNLETLGLRRLPYGPLEQIQRDRHIPLLDIGTVAAIREQRVAVRPGVEAFTPTGVRFEDGREEDFAAVVAATGYRARVSDFLQAEGVCDEAGTPRVSGREAAPGLWCCGFFVSPSGMLREIGLEAGRIADGIARSTAVSRP
jgi:cation diffusion facilitator CzcD-associated flavoprotein CzcO